MVKVTSLKIDEAVWQEAKIYCVRHDLSLYKLVNLALTKFLRLAYEAELRGGKPQ